jgi:signal transduction histidine kinase
MNTEAHRSQLIKAKATVQALQEELAQTQKGLMALTMELEQRVDERTAELQKTNAELMQLTLELEDRVAMRTANLIATNELLRAEIGERKRSESALQREQQKLTEKNALLVAIGKSQIEFLLEADPISAFGKVLDQLVGITQSEFGFIAETLYDDNGEPYMKILVISNLAWDKASEAMYEIASATCMEFHNLNNLFGVVVTSGKPVIANNPAHDPRSGGLPEGHTPLNTFLGVPFYKGEKQIGILCVANRRGGYDDKLLEYIRPFTDTLANIVESFRETRQRKQAEDELRKYQEHLEELVRERTGKLETANMDLEGFAYSVSHDLRVPLRAIDGFSQQLLKNYADKLNDEGKRYLNVVRDNTKKMSQLIDDILAFSRMGRLGISISEVNMEELAHAVFEELKPDLAGRELGIEIKPLPPCHGDPSMLRQVLINLLDNAVKFTRPKQAAQIEMGGRTEGAENIYYVKDNGAGFNMQYADKLFGVFQRLHGLAEFEGTGIGLAIVKRILTRHGGRVWAEGKVDEGATFYFALPIGEKCT